MGIAAEAFAWRLAALGIVKRTDEGQNLLQADRGVIRSWKSARLTMLGSGRKRLSSPTCLPN